MAVERLVVSANWLRTCMRRQSRGEAESERSPFAQSERPTSETGYDFQAGDHVVSFEDGWAAMNLEMPRRVPQTEYSAENALATGQGRHRYRGLDREPAGEAAGGVHRLPGSVEPGFSSGASSSRRGSSGGSTPDMGHAEYATDGADYRAAGVCPFQDPEDVYSLDPWRDFESRDVAELTRQFEEHYGRNCRDRPFGVNHDGHLHHTDVGPDRVARMGHAPAVGGDGPDQGSATWPIAMRPGYRSTSDALAAADVPVVMVHDDIVWTSGAFIQPDWYRRYVFPNYRKYFAPLRDSGKKIMYTSDGNYTAFIDDIAEAGADGFVMEPCTDMACIAERYGQTHVFVGNVDTRVLLSGSKAEIRAEVARCMDIGKGCPGFFVAVGNHIPANTPVESAMYYRDVVEELGRR